jgi:hypothetical protein
VEVEWMCSPLIVKFFREILNDSLNLFILLPCTPLTYNIAMDGAKTQPIHPKCMCGHMCARYNMECALYPISPIDLG